MTLLLAYLNYRLLQLDFHHNQIINEGAHVIVCGETYCFSYLSRGHRTVHYNRVLLVMTIDGSAFYDKNVQISSLYCSFTVFCSFLCQLLTSFITNKNTHVLLCKVGQRLMCALQCH